jgi:hypothetical protein
MSPRVATGMLGFVEAQSALGERLGGASVVVGARARGDRSGPRRPGCCAATGCNGPGQARLLPPSPRPETITSVGAGHPDARLCRRSRLSSYGGRLARARGRAVCPVKQRHPGGRVRTLTQEQPQRPKAPNPLGAQARWGCQTTPKRRSADPPESLGTLSSLTRGSEGRKSWLGRPTAPAPPSWVTPRYRAAPPTRAPAWGQPTAPAPTEWSGRPHPAPRTPRSGPNQDARPYPTISGRASRRAGRSAHSGVR